MNSKPLHCRHTIKTQSDADAGVTTHIPVVSEVQIFPVKPQDGLIAFASCVLDGAHYLGSIAIFTRLSGGYRLVYPTKKIGNRQLHVHHPISREASEALEKAILKRTHALFDCQQ